MKKIVCLIASAIIVLSLSACTVKEEVSTAKADELKAQYSFYENSVKEIRKKMDVTPEQADEIFIILTSCGMNQDINYIVGSGGKYTVDVGKIGEGVTNYYVTLENGVVSEVKDGLTVVYPEGDSSDSSDSSEIQEPGEETEVSLESAVDSAIESAHAEKDRITINDDLGTGHGKIVLIYLKAQDSLTNNMMITGMLYEARDILQALQGRDDVSEITMFWSFPLVDTYGNTEEGTIYKVNISKATLDNINFERFDYKNIPDIADDFFEHPALQN